MKKILLTASIALLLFAAPGSSGLVLTPRFMTIDFGGVPVRRAYFMDGEKKLAVTMDNETELAAHGDGAIFRFTTIPLATVELRHSPLKPSGGFSEQNIAEYAKAARLMLAPGAEVWPEEPMVLDPMRINGWKSCRFNFFYHVGGSPIRTDVTFIDLDEKQEVVVITGGTANSYSAVRSRSDDIIRRWHEVTPEEERGVN
ncbi:MAG: hypothetical protein WCF18_05940 [Chthoniobacteraceae bacterium]